MITESLFEVPISFHIFNRPETTQLVFNEIKKIRPKQLFITADGPRDNKLSDKEACEKVRLIIDDIDWECELHTNFSDINKGSFKSTSEGITWVFEHVERAIILEDDCVPSGSFFKFCYELLDYYQDDTRVSIISGNNFQKGNNEIKDSYYFSRYTHIWGWATWKRTWDKVDFSMKYWPEYKKMNGLKSIFSKQKEIHYWEEMYQGMYEKKRKPHWDFLLTLSAFMNNTVSIMPNENLVSNIGFGPDASNCKTQSEIHCLEAREMTFPLKHPAFMCRFVAHDDYTELKFFSGTYIRWKNMLRLYLPSLILKIYRPK
jgi:hypothetical protein